MKFELFDLEKIEDSRGKLIVFEKNNNCPFEVRRAFFMYGNNGSTIRGVHANKKSQFLLTAINGSCKVRVNDGYNEETFLLNAPAKSLFIDKMVWKEMFDFSCDCILLVLSSEKYDSTEYIRTLNEFLASL